MQPISLTDQQFKFGPQFSLSPRLSTVLFFCLAAALLLAIPFAADAVVAGTTTIFDSLKTTTDSAIKPLIGVLIALSVAGGIIFSLMKGSWLFAGLGVAVAGLAYGADLVSSAAGFGALI
jgi:hypothetical protein